MFEPGDHLWKKGGRLRGKLYDHHLIYQRQQDDGHLIIENSFRAGGVVQKCLTDEQLGRYILYERPADPVECLAKAHTALEERRPYRLLRYNCETFANDCVRGAGGSLQVRRGCGHVGLLSSVCSAGATSLAVGLESPQQITFTVPAKGCGGLWAWLGCTSTTVKTVYVWHPAGVAAASGAACGCCVWCIFALLGDARKRRRRA